MRRSCLAVVSVLVVAEELSACVSQTNRAPVGRIIKERKRERERGGRREKSENQVSYFTRIITTEILPAGGVGS